MTSVDDDDDAACCCCCVLYASSCVGGDAEGVSIMGDMVKMGGGSSESGSWLMSALVSALTDLGDDVGEEERMSCMMLVC